MKPKQREQRINIAERLEKIILTAKNEQDFYLRCWNDIAVWSAVFINDDSNNPLFLAPWQEEFIHLRTDSSYIWALTSRKCGKSTGLAVCIAHLLCGPDKHRISGFAPTHGQDFVFGKVREFIRGSPYLDAMFLDNDTADYVTMKNGSTLINRSIAITTQGSTQRGEYGDILYVDEIQEIDQSILDRVIFPMMADAYSEKTMYLIGTPNVYRNPQLESRWGGWKENAANNTDYAYYSIDCWRAIDEGCMNEAWVRQQQKEMAPDDFAMEYEAKFPSMSQRFYPIELLEKTLKPNASFVLHPKRGKDYIMAVDWAKFMHRTQILVGEVDPYDGMLQYAYWLQYDPKVKITDYEEQVEMVKEVFWKYDCAWICPDVTSNQDVLVEMLIRDGQSPGIPTCAFYNWEPNTDKQKLGYKASDISNDEMWRNHKQQMMKGRVRLPIQGPDEIRFMKQYQSEHYNLQTEYIRNGTAIKLVEPRGGFKDLAVCAAMLSLYLMKFDRVPALFEVGGFN